MRLSEFEQNSIKSVFANIQYKDKAELYLIGSRTEDNKKGGDIDLLLICESKNDVNHIKNKKNIISSQIQDKIGEQKIDITVHHISDKDTNVFLKSVLASAKLLFHPIVG